MDELEFEGVEEVSRKYQELRDEVDDLQQKLEEAEKERDLFYEENGEYIIINYSAIG